ncbi:uncharacterized protein LOC106868559 isoform X2 [Octopus bimaculoides]|uniref:uncharacterized protein LOC106868559 isoform X2 n=1 Tax=Octopus bimaculoides TaxID=37653 RepID=UPI00071E5906|nr:uncharacterized protein LOC106868559 isoform X2 [Octopus bimaculoides]|eukprot:XP_014769367.1 PREDICTED: uncharacterized protein LOC106868559 isoform X2 [Octopus bimaculoides]
MVKPYHVILVKISTNQNLVCHHQYRTHTMKLLKLKSVSILLKRMEIKTVVITQRKVNTPKCTKHQKLKKMTKKNEVLTEERREIVLTPLPRSTYERDFAMKNSDSGDYGRLERTPYLIM